MDARTASVTHAQGAAPRRALVVVGNGMAAVRTLEELLEVAPGAYDITVFGAEPHPGYNRILLSSVLAGEADIGGILLRDADWYARQGIDLRMGVRVERIDRARRTVHASDGSVVRYDRLLLATGSHPMIPPLPGAEPGAMLRGVLAYRDIADTEAMLRAAARGGEAVVVGGGLLGLEAAHGLARRGMRVTVVHLMPWLMERQLDPAAAGVLQAVLEERGIAFALGAQTASLEGYAGCVRAVRLKDGRELPADLVVFATGIRPNTELARAAGLACERGVRVSDTLQTFDPRIYAVGECVVHRGTVYGLVAPLYDMARVCARHLAGLGAAQFRGAVPSTRLKVTGVEVFSAGEIGAACAGAQDLVLEDPARRSYRRLVLRGERLVGAVMVGEVADAAWYESLIRSGAPVGALRPRLMFGRALAQAA